MDNKLRGNWSKSVLVDKSKYLCLVFVFSSHMGSIKSGLHCCSIFSRFVPIFLALIVVYTAVVYLDF